MREVEILKLIDKAKEFSLNSFVPRSEVLVGACALTNENMVFGGCAIENFAITASAGAATVAILKAVSEGYAEIKAVCVYKEGGELPHLTGMERDIIFQFGQDAEVILACEGNYEIYKMYELLPFSKREE